MSDLNDIWAESGFRSPESRAAWAKHFPDPDQAASWRTVHPKPATCAYLHSLGLTAKQARAWIIDNGFAWNEVHLWLACNFTATEARNWAELGILPKQARYLQDQGITAKLVKYRFGAGLRAEELYRDKKPS